jgi:uncharacterized membrane protein YfcA
MIEEAILVASAFATGILASLLGVGGGFLIVPIIMFLCGLDSHFAIGTSLMTLVFTATSSTFAYFKQKRIDYKIGLILAACTTPGAILGAYTTKFISAGVLTLLLGLLLIYVGIKVLTRSKEQKDERSLRPTSFSRKRSIVDSFGVVFDYSVDLERGMPLSFLEGFFSGLLGIGGGIVMMPVLVLGVGFPIHIAVATSMFVMIFTTLSGAITHLLLGHVIIQYVILLAIGVSIGTQIGARIARRLKSKTLERVFGASLLLLGLRIVVMYLLY